MRPYLAVLKDSFREALASRVLWIVIILVTFGLLLAAPAGISEEKTTRLQRSSVRNWPALIAKIDKQRQADGPSPGRQIWGRFSPELQNALTQSLAESPDELSGDFIFEFVEELNAMLPDPALYDPAAWQETDLGDEAEELLARGAGRLNADEVARLNRLLLRAAYPKDFIRDPRGELFFKYPFFDPIGPLQIDRPQVTALVQAFLTSIVNYVIGTVAVLAAILVTASIIPQTFEPGAIDLLLSKPVSRTSLFLTKFVGGCAFIGLIAAYFILGMWLIAGLRFDVWSNKLFLCIPILVFLFAIYYSVSALAGVLWRNAIVAVILSILFWAMCIGVRGAKTLVENWIDPLRLVKLIPADQKLFAVNERGQVWEWRERNSAWEEIFVDENRPPGPAGYLLTQPVIGPVYDARRDRLVAIQAPPPAGGMGLFGPAPNLVVGNRANGWVRKKGTAPPVGTVALFASPRGEVVAVTKAAVYRLAGEPAPAPKPGSKSERFVRSGPEPPLRLEPGATTAQNPDNGAIAIFNRGVVTVLVPDESGTYSRKVEKEVSSASDEKTALVAFGGKSLLVALPDGRVLVLDAATLELMHEYRPQGEVAPRFAAVSPGGRWFSVVFHNRRLWMYDVRESRAANFWFTGQGNVSAAAFAGPDRLLVADHGTRISQYQLDPFRHEEGRSQPLGSLERTYYYGLIPIYTIFPKPGELDKAFEYVLKDSDRAELDPRPPDLSRVQEPVDVAGPIWTSLAFMTVMLALSSLYVWRSDF